MLSFPEFYRFLGHECSAVTPDVRAPNAFRGFFFDQNERRYHRAPARQWPNTPSDAGRNGAGGVTRRSGMRARDLLPCARSGGREPWIQFALSVAAGIGGLQTFGHRREAATDGA